MAFATAAAAGAAAEEDFISWDVSAQPAAVSAATDTEPMARCSTAAMNHASRIESSTGAPASAANSLPSSALIPDAEMIFDPEPAPILGGCWISTNDNRRQVNSDWQSLTQEMADTLAERLLPLL